MNYREQIEVLTSMADTGTINYKFNKNSYSYGPMDDYSKEGTREIDEERTAKANDDNRKSRGN